MKMILAGIILLCAVLYQVAVARGGRGAAAPWRMATILASVALALTGLSEHPEPAFAWAVGLGLSVSVFGDLFFVLPQERFVPGLVAYLLGHLCYITGMFWTAWPVASSSFLVLGGLGLLTFFLFRPIAAGMQRTGRGDLVTPAVVYAVVLTAMLWQALSAGTPLLAAAGLLYYVADTVMVWHRFVRPVRHQQLVEFSCYFGAQFCFAASVALPITQ